MKFRCAGIKDSMIDGNGIAFTVYFQGCSIHCDGCHNETLQDFDGGFEVNVDDIVKKFQNNLDFYDSFVILGGEPLDQRHACIELINKVGELIYGTEKFLWLYSGYKIDKAELENGDLYPVDVLVTGPFVKHKYVPNAFPASRNQRVLYNFKTETCHRQAFIDRAMKGKRGVN
jgi:anaerobic ribonucleoside-triphosphate reductase activating protein